MINAEPWQVPCPNRLPPFGRLMAYRRRRVHVLRRASQSVVLGTALHAARGCRYLVTTPSLSEMRKARSEQSDPSIRRGVVHLDGDRSKVLLKMPVAALGACWKRITHCKLTDEPMRGIEIWVHSQTDNALAFDLADILRAIGPQAEQSIWKIEGLECFGDAAEFLHDISDNGRVIGGKKLIRLADQVYQTIDGHISGYRSDNDKHPWIIIRAVDGSSFDVECGDATVLDRLRQHFNTVTDLPS